MTCSQCGKRWSERACGPTHATVFAWMEVERRRIRRAIAPALKELRDAIGEQDRTLVSHQTRRLYGYVAAIDRATRAPRKGRAR